MDTIQIKDLRFHGRHGVLPEENALGQTFLVTLTLESDLRPAGTSDDLKQSIDYRGPIAVAREIVEGPPVKLLETLAERIAGDILARFPAIHAVTVETGKPAPPLPETCGGVFVKIHRTRP